ncbi:hypothetical protein I6E29_03345 [Arcanobacterium haemolyticum]|nr:hypothetical protein [Arcanobacterium haemolyticum]
MAHRNRRPRLLLTTRVVFPKATCFNRTKIRYPDEVSAKLALDYIRSHAYRPTGKKEQRAYLCPACLGWHLTSSPQRAPRVVLTSTSAELRPSLATPLSKKLPPAPVIRSSALGNVLTDEVCSDILSGATPIFAELLGASLRRFEAERRQAMKKALKERKRARGAVDSTVPFEDELAVLSTSVVAPKPSPRLFANSMPHVSRPLPKPSPQLFGASSAHVIKALPYRGDDIVTNSPVSDDSIEAHKPLTIAASSTTPSACLYPAMLPSAPQRALSRLSFWHRVRRFIRTVVNLLAYGTYAEDISVESSLPVSSLM